jgi:hypothetical protein
MTSRGFLSSGWRPVAVVFSALWITASLPPSFGQDVALVCNGWKPWSPEICTITDYSRLEAQKGAQSEPVPPQVPLEPNIPAERFAALPSETVALASSVGYIDPAIPRTQIRLRYDDVFHDPRPDRAEFLYAKYGFYATPASLTIAGVPPDPNAKGPLGPSRGVNFQDVDTYLEAALDRKLSIFVGFPVRFAHPIDKVPHEGFSDMSAGFKYAFLYQENQVATFQLSTYIPTGESRLWLGNNHVTVEPALLYFRGLSDRLALEGELKDWVPIGGTNFAGNIVNYGLGVSYRLFAWGNFSVNPVAEFVGWTVLNGKESVVFGPRLVQVQEAGGDTIVNAKVGARFWFGSHNDLYVGYGRALTGPVWYKDIFRLEYRLGF